MLEALARDEHSSLLRTFANRGRKKIYCTDTWLVKRISGSDRVRLTDGSDEETF